MHTWKLTWQITTRGHIKRESAHYTTREAAQKASDELVRRELVESQPEIEESEI